MSNENLLTTFTTRELQLMAAAWDAAVSALKYEDGSPVEVVKVVNPYRIGGAA